MSKSSEKVVEFEVREFNAENLNLWLVGETPFIYNAMSAKIKGQLLFPPPKKTAADKAQKMKHDPSQEFMDTMYLRDVGEDGNTKCIIPSVMIKAAVGNAAIEVPGMKKAQIGRLLWVNNDYLDMYGDPKMIMRVMRSSDMNHTPDIRTRAILPRWACRCSIQFVTPTLNSKMVVQLLAVAGMAIGIGDSRPQKGHESYGKFHVVNDKDDMKDYIEMGHDSQVAAIKRMDAYDKETRELYEWFVNEKAARGR